MDDDAIHNYTLLNMQYKYIHIICFISILIVNIISIHFTIPEQSEIKHYDCKKDPQCIEEQSRFNHYIFNMGNIYCARFILCVLCLVIENHMFQHVFFILWCLGECLYFNFLFMLHTPKYIPISQCFIMSCLDLLTILLDMIRILATHYQCVDEMEKRHDDYIAMPDDIE